MKIYRIMGMHGHTTIPWKIRDSMGLKASDVISFEYGAFGNDIILVRRELSSESDGIGGVFAVHGVRVYQTENGGNYVSMPFNQYKDNEGKTQFSEICHPVTSDLRHQLTQSVMTAYDQALQQAQQQGVSEAQSAAPKLKPEM